MSRRTLIPWVIALAVGATGCAGDDPAPVVETDPPPECTEDGDCDDQQICEEQTCILGDRDDEFEGATPLFLVSDFSEPGVKSGLIHEAGDVDHYAFNAVESGWYRISTTSPDGDDSLDTVVSVFRQDGSLHHVMDDYGTGRLGSWDSRMQVYLPEPGIWYIRVEDRGTFYDDETPRGAPSFSYRVGIETWGSISVEPDSAEDPSVRFPMTGGSVVYAWGVNMEEPGDIDWTTATMPFGDAPFEIWAPEDIPGSSMRPVVEARDEDGNLHLRKVDVGASGNANTFTSDELTFTVQVTDADGGGSQDHWTVLFLRTRAEGSGNPREVEPNDELESATPLDSEVRTSNGVTSDVSFLQGKLDLDNDVDHFRFAAVQDAGLRMACSSDRFGSVGDIDADLIDPTGAVVETFTEGDDSAPDADIEGLVEGAYTLRFRLVDGAYGPAASYRCGVYVDRP